MTALAGRPKTGLDANAMIVGGILLLGALWSLFAAANGADANMRVHAWVIGAGFVLGLFGMNVAAKIYEAIAAVAAGDLWAAVVEWARARMGLPARREG